MKIQIKLNLVFLAVFGISIISTGQIKVSTNNYVGINYSSTPLSRFVINAAGNSGYQAYIYNPNISVAGGALMLSSEKGTGTGVNITSLLSQTTIGSNNYLYGLKATASNASTPYTVGRSYGVYGVASNSTTGFNYSIYGSLLGSNNGAAVFGAISGKGDIGLTQQWAGYFRGDVKVENTLWVNTTSYSSDSKFKTNISSLDPSESLSNLLKINPVKYNLKQFEIKVTGCDTIKVSNYYDEASQLFTKAKFGVIAQELQVIFPDLVHSDGEGDLGVDYIGLVPVIIKVVQTQQKKIEEFQETIDLLTKEVNELKQK
ncbi:MAG TPA: tail fiber domain-containing protein [Candidatus Cloacimonadota bacterium]|jgi:hypothetical protein|nr:tail fiber domain-containing protein [Candidatus Cloacimonadota bacterium]